MNLVGKEVGRILQELRKRKEYDKIYCIKMRKK